MRVLDITFNEKNTHLSGFFAIVMIEVSSRSGMHRSRKIDTDGGVHEHVCRWWVCLECVVGMFG